MIGTCGIGLPPPHTRRLNKYSGPGKLHCGIKWIKSQTPERVYHPRGEHIATVNARTGVHGGDTDASEWAAIGPGAEVDQKCAAGSYD